MINGKTTSANWLENNYGYRKYSFAEDVKYAAAKMLTCFSELVHDVPREISVDELAKRKQEIEVRKFLQLTGTEIAKSFFHDPDVWVRRLEKKIKYNLSPTAIDDCRFPNEQEMLKRHDFLFIRVVRDDYERVLVQQYQEAHPSYPSEQIAEMVRDSVLHPSEQYIDSLHSDITIHATTIEELYRKLEINVGGYFGTTS